MNEILKQRQAKLNEFFQGEINWPSNTDLPTITAQQEEHLQRHNMEWHVIPGADAVPLDEAYFERLYPLRSREFGREGGHQPDFRRVLREGHARQQGRVVAIETTRKPGYLPGNAQHYGSCYGFDADAEPFSRYMGGAHLHSGTRYNHTYNTLYDFLITINTDWMDRGLMPDGYRLTICPPGVWNLLGTVFYPSWSQTATLEMGFYRDSGGNARCYAMGSSEPGDYSYLRAINSGADWSLMGFRTVLMPIDSAI